MNRLQKFILVFLSAALFLGLVLVIRLVIEKSTQPKTKAEPLAAAKLSLSPAGGSFKPGEIFEIKIELDTGGARSSGTDVELWYEPEKLEIQKITPGALYSLYLNTGVDKDAKTTRISGVSDSAAKLFSGTGTFAVIEVKGLSPGTGRIFFNFTAGEKNDSNVAAFDTQNDILASVENGLYTFVNPSPTPNATATPRPPSVTPVPSISPRPTATATPRPSPKPTAIPTPFPSPSPSPSPISQSDQPELSPPVGGGEGPDSDPGSIPRTGSVNQTIGTLTAGIFLVFLGTTVKLLR